jgi:putative ABC transport system substrate-binding protein
MRRREFIGLVGGGAAAALPLAARAQQGATSGRMAKIGVLWHAGSPEEEGVYFDVLMKAFGDLGYVEGRNAVFQHRFPAEQAERFRIFARELVNEKPDVIIAVTAPGAVEIKQASDTIPIVVVLAPDPVRDGLVESLAHPGGSVTGLSLMNSDLSGKRIALLQEAVPNLSRLALVYDPHFSGSAPPFVNSAKAASLELRTVSVEAPDAIGEAFSTIARDGVQGVIITGSMLYNERVRVAAAALASRLPTLTVIGEMVQNVGILMSYGQDLPDYFRKSAGYADKILKGAKPKDLPVEQPTRFKLVLNLKTAKAIGVAIPTSLVVEADDVIE